MGQRFDRGIPRRTPKTTKKKAVSPATVESAGPARRKASTILRSSGNWRIVRSGRRARTSRIEASDGALGKKARTQNGTTTATSRRFHESLR